MMSSPNSFFLGNRLWWSFGLFLGPVIGAFVRDPAMAFVASGILILPVFVIFDTDRPWWSDEIRRIEPKSEQSRREARKLTLWSGIALALGIAVAVVGPWGLSPVFSGR
jgi:hypothetical protein